MNAEDELIPTRASLLGRLKDWKDEASWKVFFETYWKLIYNAAIKAGLTDAEAQDVVQETVISVSKSMPSFEYDAVGGSFKSWLLKLTAWRIVDQKRRRDVRPAQRRSDSTTRTATVERIADPAESDLEAIWNEEWEKNLMSGSNGRSMQSSTKFSTSTCSRIGRLERSPARSRSIRGGCTWPNIESGQ